MSAQGKTKAVKEWLETWPELGGYLKLNGTELKDGERSINTVFSDNVVSEFIGGKKVKEYVFALVLVANWSSGYDAVNEEAENLASAWVDWVNAQMQAGNVPDFGSDCDIRGIESLYDKPALAMVYQEEMLAKYMFQAKITYWEG